MYEDPLAQETSLVLRVGEQAYLDVYRDGASVPAVTVDGGQGVVDRLGAQFGDLEVRAGADVAEEISQQIRDGLSFVSYFLVAFGLVGLLVGTFLIANTFSMIVAQRTREFALLRALGAARGQITRSVAFESALVGVIGSALGVAGGVGLVALIRVAMARYGMPLPDAGTGLSVRAVVVPIVVGTLVTVLSALAPARKAGQVKPVEAMRSSEAATPQPLRWRTVAGLVLVATGVAADYFLTAWHKKFFTQLVFNAFPVDRRGEGANRGLSKKLLAAGIPLLIFPEGTRSKTGKMAPFQIGAASLALSTQVPVVPVALIGAHEAMPRGANWPRRGRPPVVVAVGAPLRARSNENAIGFNERIEAAVRALYAANRHHIRD